MVDRFSRFKAIFIFTLVFLPVVACSLWPPPPSARPSEYGILSPVMGALVLAGNPVQILSAFENPENISRIELLVQPAGGQESLLRSDLPSEEGTVTQQWVPQLPGSYEIKARAYGFDNQIQKEAVRQLEVVPNISVSEPAVSLLMKFDPSAIPGLDPPADTIPPPMTVNLIQAQADCPTVNKPIEIRGAGQIVRLEEGSVLARIIVSTQQSIELDFQEITKAANFRVVVESPRGNIIHTSPVSGDFFSYSALKPGEYLIRLEADAINESCAPVAYAAIVEVREIATPTPTPTPTSTPTPAPTPTPFYPPPPSMPGVPPGPTQAEIPAMSPPVCDAAEYLGVYTGDGDTKQRIFIPTEDQLPAKVVAGTLVHRAWRLRNIGTCTWGPGYELAFYGGRSMGSGGVAFEFFFPPEPARRNVVIDQNRVIAPEGKPNQISVLELLLNTPAIPGIHQSYWRMRNPQGVYFGPIIGVTMDVVRNCQPEPNGSRIYGAPVINSFLIVGAPEGAGETVPYKTEINKSDRLRWNVLGAENIQIVQKDPSGTIETTSIADVTGEVVFKPAKVGVYEVTLYVDNGSCTVTKTLTIHVRPPEGAQFLLEITRSSEPLTGGGQGGPVTPPLNPESVPVKPVAGAAKAATTSAAVAPGNIRVEWQHYDSGVNKIILVAGLQRNSVTKSCLVPDWEWTCSTSETGWQPAGAPVNLSLRGDPIGDQTVTNLQNLLCPSSPPASTEKYQIYYQVQAEINGIEADPPGSNFVTDIESCEYSSPTTLDAPTLPTEIE